MKKKKLTAIAVSAVGLPVIAATICFFAFKNDNSNAYPNANPNTDPISASNELTWQKEMEIERTEKIETIRNNLDVTAEEIAGYSNMIGDSMDIKKSVLIMFNTADECREFIENIPPDYSTNIGVRAISQSDENGEYFNVVGNEILETVFDSLEDGEFLEVPIEYAGAYCFFKRLGISSPIDSEEKLIEFIRSEKAQIELMKEGLQ